MYKEVRMIQCQRLPAIEGKVKLKILRNNLILNDETCQ